MGTWKKVLTSGHIDPATSLGTSDSVVPSQKAVKNYVDSNAGGGSSYETIFCQKRYANMTTTTWRGSSVVSSTHSAQVWSLSTAIQSGSVPVNYSDTTMSGWVGIQYSMFQAAADCEVDAWTAQAHQNNCNTDIRLGLWKGTARTALETNHSSASQIVDFIGYVDFDADSDTSSLHQPQTITSSGNRLNSTAKVLGAGDQLYIFATLKPGNTGTDTAYWHVNSSIRIKYT